MYAETCGACTEAWLNEYIQWSMLGESGTWMSHTYEWIHESARFIRIKVENPFAALITHSAMEVFDKTFNEEEF